MRKTKNPFFAGAVYRKANSVKFIYDGFIYFKHWDGVRVNTKILSRASAYFAREFSKSKVIRCAFLDYPTFLSVYYFVIGYRKQFREHLENFAFMPFATNLQKVSQILNLPKLHCILSRFMNRKLSRRVLALLNH